MTTPVELLSRAAALGLRLEPAGDRLAVTPRDKVPPDFAEELRASKAALLAHLTAHPPGWGAVPPSDLPLDPVMPCPSPEDRERMIGYLLAQGCHRPAPLTAWLVLRESAYYDGPGRHWDCGLLPFAAARDAACWQLCLPEAAVAAMLARTEHAGAILTPEQKELA